MADIVSQFTSQENPETTAPGVSLAPVQSKSSFAGALTEKIVPVLAAHAKLQRGGAETDPNAVVEPILERYNQYYAENAGAFDRTTYQRFLEQGVNELNRAMIKAGVKPSQQAALRSSFESSFVSVQDRFIERSDTSVHMIKDLYSGSTEIITPDKQFVAETIAMDAMTKLPPTIQLMEEGPEKASAMQDYFELHARAEEQATLASIQTSLTTQLTESQDRITAQNKQQVPVFTQRLLEPLIGNTTVNLVKQVQSGALSVDAAKALVDDFYNGQFLSTSVIEQYNRMGVDANQISKDYAHVLPTLKNLIDAYDPDKELDRDTLSLRQQLENRRSRLLLGLSDPVFAKVTLSEQFKNISISQEYLKAMQGDMYSNVDAFELMAQFSNRPGISEFSGLYTKIADVDFTEDDTEKYQAMNDATALILNSLTNVASGYADPNKPMATVEDVLYAAKLIQSNKVWQREATPELKAAFTRRIGEIRNRFKDNPEAKTILDKYLEEETTEGFFSKIFK